MRIFLVTLLASSVVPCFAATPILDCEFSNALLVRQSEQPQVQAVKVRQKMKVVAWKTTPETMKLDGSLRATNSRNWKPIELKRWETWESSFVGDFREVLSLKHELGANRRPLSGKYSASLVSPGVEETSILIGTCEVQ